MKLLNTLRWAILAALVAIVVTIALRLRHSPEANTHHYREARITGIRSAMELCTLEFIEDLPIKGHIGTKHIFARTTLCGYVAFNLDSIATEIKGDTLTVILPPEIVEINESTQPSSYEVIDTWNEKLLGSSRLSTAEENAIKRKAVDNFRKSVYAKGYVRQARADAVATLGRILPLTTAGPVKIIDPSPEGYPQTAGQPSKPVRQ